MFASYVFKLTTKNPDFRVFAKLSLVPKRISPSAICLKVLGFLSLGKNRVRPGETEDFFKMNDNRVVTHADFWKIHPIIFFNLYLKVWHKLCRILEEKESRGESGRSKVGKMHRPES